MFFSMATLDHWNTSDAHTSALLREQLTVQSILISAAFKKALSANRFVQVTLLFSIFALFAMSTKRCPPNTVHCLLNSVVTNNLLACQEALVIYSEF